MFLCVNDIEIASYADDNIPYSCSKDLQDVLRSLEKSTERLFEWFDNNSMKSNPEKCHLLVKSDEPVSVNICGSYINNSSSQKLLGVTIDSRLTFESHINQLCTRASQKIGAISRISPFMNLSQRKLIMNAFLCHSLVTVHLSGWVTVEG